jgi:acetophenone carboxylase
MTRRQITEYLAIDLASETWHCRQCEESLTHVENSYKRGCHVRERNPREVHRTFGDHEEYNFAPHPDWTRVLEYFCPECGTMVEVEYLPPGHPITHDIELDIEALKRKTDGVEADGGVDVEEAID